MEGPLVKRPKLLADATLQEAEWLQWYDNLETLQGKLLTGCLCQITNTITLQRPIFSSLLQSEVGKSSPDFPSKYTLQFISTLKLLCELAVSQRGIGFICTKVSEMANVVSTDEGIWETLLQLLGSSDKFISYISSKCLTSLIILTKVPTVSQAFEELLNSVVTNTRNPLLVTNTLEVIRGVIDHGDEEEHPLQLLGSGLHGTCNPKPHCTKIEIEEDPDSEVEVKDICITALESWWTRLITKFKTLLANYEEKYEHSITTFLSLWQSIVSVKSNLNIVDTKHFYLQVGSFVSHLSSALPPSLWKKLLDVFNEILCYGSTLSLQDSLPEEPCDLAHLILRCVKSRHFLQGVPYSRSFVSFGGTSWIKPADSGWESEPDPEEGTSSNRSRIEPKLDEAFSLSTGGGMKLPSSYSSAHIGENPGESGRITNCVGSSTESATISPQPVTIYIGPSPFAVHEELEELDAGDRPLVQKVVLLILKCVAVTVRETKEEVDTSDEEEDPEEAGGGGQRSPTDSDFNDMVIIERTVREVFGHLDSYVKSILPYHPATPLCEWIVKLFSDQDDVLVEGLLCSLDSFTSFIGRIDITTDFYQQFNPVRSFMAFAETISEDKTVLMDLLMGNETCFLLYLLRLLKYISKNWEKFTTTCGRDLSKIMGLFIRLKISLVNSPHFPYNIDPIIRLLERCENNYEAASNSSAVS